MWWFQNGRKDKWILEQKPEVNILENFKIVIK